MQVQDIFEDLTDPRADNPPDGDTVYTKTIRMLDTHFEVPPNVPFERHLFRQLTFNGGETVSQFAVRLRQQARYCQFGVHVDEHIRDQLLDRLPDQSLKTKLLQETDLSLEKTLRMARTWELAGMQAGKMTVSAGASVNAVQPKKLPRGQRSTGQRSQAASLPRRNVSTVDERATKPTTTLAQRKGKAVTNVGSPGIFRRNAEPKRPRRRKTGTDVDDPRTWSVHRGTTQRTLGPKVTRSSSQVWMLFETETVWDEESLWLTWILVAQPGLRSLTQVLAATSWARTSFFSSNAKGSKSATYNTVQRGCIGMVEHL